MTENLCSCPACAGLRERNNPFEQAVVAAFAILCNYGTAEGTPERQVWEILANVLGRNSK